MNNGKAKDHTGRKFGRLLALERISAKDSIFRRTSYLCQCDCGNQLIVRSVSLITGNSKSCGCLNDEIVKSSKLISIAGRTFGRWTAIERIQTLSKGTKWRCLCSCGKEGVVLTSSLTSGNSKSCGCLNIEKIIERNHDPKLIVKRMKNANDCYIQIHWKTKQELLCKGRWERNVVGWFNQMKLDFDWQIPFALSDGRTYIIDLYDKTLGVYVEIKGWWRDDAQGKFDLFKSDNPTLKTEIWGIQELRSRKISVR
jgi:hypothetical protein